MNGWLWLTPVIAGLGGWVAGMIIKRKILRTLPRMIREFTASLRVGMRQHPVTEQAGPTAGSHDEQSGPFEQIRPFIEEQADHFFRHRLVQAMPMVGTLIGEKTIQQMKAVLMQELEELFPVVMEKYLSIVTTGAVDRENFSRNPAVGTAPDTTAHPPRHAASSSHDSNYRRNSLFSAGAEISGNPARSFRQLPLWGLLTGLAIGGLQLLYLAFVFR